MFRSLVRGAIVELLPRHHESGRKVRVNIDLQEDFSLNQALGLWLVETVQTIDPELPTCQLRQLYAQANSQINPLVSPAGRPCPAPARQPDGGAGGAIAQGDGDLGLEQPLGVPGQTVGGDAEQVVGGVVHDSNLGGQRERPLSHAKLTVG